MFVKPKIESTTKSTNQYRLHRFTWWQCFFTDLPFTVMIIALFLFMVVVYVKTGYLEVFIGFIGILAFMLERTKFWYEGGKIRLEIDDNGVRLSNGKYYKWGEIDKVDIPPCLFLNMVCLYLNTSFTLKMVINFLLISV